MRKINKLFKKSMAGIAVFTAVFAFSQIASANNFDLNSINADDLYSFDYQNISLAEASAPVQKSDTIGGQLNLRVPFVAVKKAVKTVVQNRKELSLINENLPVISKYGENLQIKNIRLDIGGIIVEPGIIFKPYSEAKNVLSIKIQRIKIRASMQPSKSLAGAGVQELNQEEIMAKAMEAAIKGIIDALNEKFAAGNINLKAEDMLKFKYDKDAWTLKTRISIKFINQYAPAGLMGDVSLNSFSFDDKAIFIGIGAN